MARVLCQESAPPAPIDLRFQVMERISSMVCDEGIRRIDDHAESKETPAVDVPPVMGPGASVTLPAEDPAVETSKSGDRRGAGGRGKQGNLPLVAADEFARSLAALRRHAQRLMGKELRAWVEPEDVVEETFVRLATAGRDLVSVSLATLQSCTRHVVADLARRAAVNRAAVNRAAVAAGSGTDPREYLRAEREIVARVRQMEFDDFDVVLGRLLMRGLRSREIAGRFGLTYDMVRQRVRRIRQRKDLFPAILGRPGPPQNRPVTAAGAA